MSGKYKASVPHPVPGSSPSDPILPWTMDQISALRDVLAERQRQDAKTPSSVSRTSTRCST